MNKKEREFAKEVWEYYRRHGRHDLPWRKTHNPYRIAVSEIMLQQTQVERVLPKYKAFIKQFPTARALARAPLGEVLRVWQGLGYNRRAKMLRACAEEVVRLSQPPTVSSRSSRNIARFRAPRGTRNNAKQFALFPKTFQELQKLPGIGSYAAAAIMAFAYNEPVPMIETNIRTVYLHHFFKDTHSVADKDIVQLVERTMDVKDPRKWYWALMDYGAHLKRSGVRINAQSRHYTRQSTFKDSDRQIRGAILRVLAARGATRTRLSALPFEKQRINEQLEKLIKEGMVTKRGSVYRLP